MNFANQCYGLVQIPSFFSSPTEEVQLILYTLFCLLAFLLRVSSTAFKDAVKFLVSKWPV